MVESWVVKFESIIITCGTLAHYVLKLLCLKLNARVVQARYVLTGVKITVNHRPKSGDLVRLAVHSAQWPAYYLNKRNECIRMHLLFNYIVE